MKAAIEGVQPFQHFQLRFSKTGYPILLRFRSFNVFHLESLGIA